MKIVDRATFLKMPIGTVYAKYGDREGSANHLSFDEVRIKDRERGEKDWWSVGFTNPYG